MRAAGGLTGKKHNYCKHSSERAIDCINEGRLGVWIGTYYERLLQVTLEWYGVFWWSRIMQKLSQRSYPDYHYVFLLQWLLGVSSPPPGLHSLILLSAKCFGSVPFAHSQLVAGKFHCTWLPSFDTNCIN